VPAAQQAVLLLVLATMVYAVSLDLRIADFRYVARHPLAVGIGLVAAFILPPAERAARMRDPALKTRILSEPPVRMARDGTPVPPIIDQILASIEQTAALMFPLESRHAAGPDYEPDPKTSFAARAAARGLPALALDA